MIEICLDPCRAGSSLLSRVRGVAVTVITASMLLAARASVAGQGQAPSRWPAPASVLDYEIPRLIEAADVPGFSGALVLGGEVAWIGAFGVADTDSGTPATPETIFQAASLTKQLTAYTALRLADRGVIDLDRPLAEYLPYERLAHEDRYGRITGSMALSHSTGLPNWGGDRLTLDFDPGAGFQYSGEGYVYLQKALEALTGKGLDELVREEILDPLGLEDSWMAWRASFEGRTAARHDEWGESGGVSTGVEVNAAWSLLTTARDYARFIVHLLDGGGLAPATMARALEPRVQVASNPALDTTGRLYWGLGWGIQTGSGGRAIWQWGHNDGFRGYLIAYPERKGAFIYFTNGDNGLSIAPRLLELVGESAGWPADEHWALDWLDYERYDDPMREAARDVVEGFRAGGIDAGLARYDAARTAPGIDPELLAARTVNALGSRGIAEGQVAILERNVELHPGSVEAWIALAEILIGAGRYADAIAGFESASRLDPGNGRASRGRAWVEPLLAAVDDRPAIPTDVLERYVGDYGPRHVTLEDGVLYYRRDDNPRTRLRPLSKDTFQPESSGTFRIRFMADGPGAASRIVGLYLDGNRDESTRDP